MFWSFVKGSRRRFFLGIYWRAISYFSFFWPFLESMLKEIRNYVKRFLSERRRIILTMGKLFLGVKYFLNFFFHDDFELRVNLNLPSGHIHSGFYSCVSLWRRLRKFLHSFSALYNSPILLSMLGWKVLAVFRRQCQQQLIWPSLEVWSSAEFELCAAGPSEKHGHWERGQLLKLIRIYSNNGATAVRVLISIWTFFWSIKAWKFEFLCSFVIKLQPIFFNNQSSLFNPTSHYTNVINWPHLCVSQEHSFDSSNDSMRTRVTWMS